MKEPNIAIGIIDAKNRNERSATEKNSSIYYSANGVEWPSNRKKGEGFKPRSVVELNVTESGTVTFKVDGIIVSTQNFPRLTEAGKIFVPFVEVKSPGDKFIFEL